MSGTQSLKAQDLFNVFLEKVKESGDVAKLLKYAYKAKPFVIAPLYVSELVGPYADGGYAADAIFLISLGLQVNKLMRGKILVSSNSIMIVIGRLWLDVDMNKLKR